MFQSTKQNILLTLDIPMWTKEEREEECVAYHKICWRTSQGFPGQLNVTLRMFLRRHFAKKPVKLRTVYRS